jgi:hypothetical protein
MISIDEAYVNAAAPNAEANKNGRALVLKGKFLKLQHDAEQTVLFGECQGSGKEPYRCSCDFARPDQPTFRCNCPSRQFPCKHNVGLLFAWVLKPTEFKSAEIPADLAEKREKLASKVEKKKETVEKPKQVNKSALAKKIQAQLNGIDLLEQLTLDLVKLGIGNTSAKTAREIEEKAKQLGNAYIPGAQAALHRYTKLFTNETGAFESDAPSSVREAVFGEALDQLARLHALVKQGRAYLQRRLEDADLKPETESPIAAWLGHAWQLTELKAAGLVEANAELLQVAFNSYIDLARQEFVDTGAWMQLNTGRIFLSQNYRPFKAAKYIRSEDSFFQVACIPELCIYPGDVNPRVRWEGMTPRAVTAADWRAVAQHAHADFATVVKQVKNNLKAPLAEKQPIYALRFARLGTVEQSLVVEDAQGERLVLTDRGMTDEPPSCHLMRLLPTASLSNQTLIARFRHDVDSRKLQIKPLAIATEHQLIRLTL